MDSEPRGWIRSNWLAEKISSGELPAASCDLTQQCDALFVGPDRLEDHARVLAACLRVPRGRTADAPGPPSQDLLAYLQRLLSLREMWARERC